MSNPFVQTTEPVAVATEPLDLDALFGADSAALALHGPAAPSGLAVPIADGQTPWPAREISRAVPIAVLGLHGGAGASTLVELLGAEAYDAGTSWPVFAGWERPAPSVPVVAVTRTHHRGLDAVTRFAGQWASGALAGGHLLGVVLVDDAPKLTAAQQTAARRALRMTPHGWHVRWQEPWRLTPPDLPAAPKRVRDTIRNIRATADQLTGAAA